jgi:hypothetical protein
MSIVEKLRCELSSIEESLFYLEETDMAWSRAYTKLWRQKLIVKSAIRKLERLERKEKK